MKKLLILALMATTLNSYAVSVCIMLLKDRVTYISCDGENFRVANFTDGRNISGAIKKKIESGYSVTSVEATATEVIYSLIKKQ